MPLKKKSEIKLGFKAHYQLLATYNQRMNEQIYVASTRLNQSEFEKDVGAYFGSILGTLNHIMVGDILWLTRFRTHSEKYKSLSLLESYPIPASLNEVLYRDIGAMKIARSGIDEIINEWVSETEDSEFDEVFSYKNSKGATFQKKFSSVVGHFFNHQTHHRGQVSALLCQFGVDIGVTDFIVDVPEEQA